MGLGWLFPYLRHPALAFLGAAVFGLAALVPIRGALDAAEQFAIADDPAQISDRALDRIFDRGVAEREIRSALAAGDLDLAQSFLDLAGERGVPVDPRVSGQVNDAQVRAASPINTAGRFLQGFWSGEPADLASLAGTAAGDLFVFGDIRDAAREGTRYLTGQPADPWILGLAGVGIAITAGTYVTVGVGAPARAGLTLVKAARRAGKLSTGLTAWIGRSLRAMADWGALSRAVGLSAPVLAVNATRDAVKVEEAGGLVELAANVGSVETKAGTQAALDSLKVAEGPADMSRLARLAAVKGGKTRAIVKLLGRAAIVLAVGAFDLATWLFWAALMLFGFVSSCKAMVERVTLRHLARRKVRRARAAERRASAMPALA